MKKVCFVIDSLSGGGAEKCVINLAREFNSHGYESHIICLSKIVSYEIGNISYHPLLDTVEYPSTLMPSRLDAPRRWYLITRILYRIIGQHKLLRAILHRRTIRRLQDKIKEFGPFDAIFSNLPDSDLLCISAGLPNLYCCIHNSMNYRVAALISPRAKFYKVRHPLYCKQYRHFYKGQNLITVSDELKENTLSFGIKPASIRSIYNLFDFDKIRLLSEKHQVEEDDYIIHAGRMEPVKNLRMLINAYNQSGISAKLLLLGRGSEEHNLRQLVAEKKLQNKVIFKEFIQNPYPYIKKVKALVLASNYEGLPTILIEALILGTPVVSTSCPTGPKEILTGELAEFLSPPGDTEALAKNIRKVIDNPPQIRDEHIAKFHKEVSFRKYLALAEGDNSIATDAS